MHKVHRPALIGLCWHCQGLWLLPNNPLLGLDAHIEPQGPIEPIHPFVVPTKSLDVAKKQEAQSKVPVTLTGGQSDQPVSNLSILVTELGLVAIARLADLQALTGQANTDAVLTNPLLGQLSGAR